MINFRWAYTLIRGYLLGVVTSSNAPQPYSIVVGSITEPLGRDHRYTTIYNYVVIKNNGKVIWAYNYELDLIEPRLGAWFADISQEDADIMNDYLNDVEMIIDNIHKRAGSPV
jgi:hypothetical protein